MSCPIVSTRNGKLEGSVSVLKCKNARSVYSYRNIPFAKPPLGSLRFMPTEPAEPWRGIRDVSDADRLPMQSVAGGEMMDTYFPMKKSNKERLVDEDCLYISVYTPYPQKGKKLPVMVWFYGGAFQMGSQGIYDGSALAGMNDVVVAVPNYRLGIFGFFTLGQSSVCPGNAGLWDQKMALKWVQENIDAFGGDKNNVTIFGESSGGISVNYLVNSPESRGLFHKAIGHSGQATMPGAFHLLDDISKNNAGLFKNLGIEDLNETQILGKLQEMKSSELQAVYEAMAMKKMSYFPCLDGKFFLKTPEQSLADKDFARVPYIIGWNKTEGYGLLTAAVPGFGEGLSEDATRAGFFIPVTDKHFNACKSFYIQDKNDDLRFSKFFGDYMGDTMFIVPGLTAASAYSDAGCDVYMYRCDFQLRLSHDKKFGPDVTQKSAMCICDHTDDIYMTFGVPFTPGELPLGAKFSEKEVELSQRIMTYITNFARNGKPNNGRDVELEWPKYKPGGEHLIFDHALTTKKNLGSKSLQFWTKGFPEMMGK